MEKSEPPQESRQVVEETVARKESGGKAFGKKGRAAVPKPRRQHACRRQDQEVAQEKIRLRRSQCLRVVRRARLRHVAVLLGKDRGRNNILCRLSPVLAASNVIRHRAVSRDISHRVNLVGQDTALPVADIDLTKRPPTEAITLSNAKPAFQRPILLRVCQPRRAIADR